MKTLAVLGALVAAASAQAPAWAQCGGQGWSGATTCVSGYSCTVVNEWYHQCQPGSAPPAPTTTTSRATTTSRPTTTGGGSNQPAPTGWRWFGVDESVAEFGTGKWPGVHGVDFRFPDESAISTLINEGMNTFRVAFLMERLTLNSISDSFEPRYLANLTQTINFITNKGAYAILDPHNYGRYKGAIITDTTAFGNFFARLAAVFKDNQRVIFDTNNEYNTMDQTLVLNLNQAAINGIRRGGATSQWIFAEGNSWTGAWTWTDVNDNMKALTDPQNRLVYQMHQYLDSDGSGTSAVCVSGTIGVERLRKATQWLRDNKKLGVLGEYAGGPNEVCKQAVKGMLDFMKENSDVWTGALWWAAGPWWADYMYSYEPPSGPAYTYYNSLLRQYVVR